VSICQWTATWTVTLRFCRPVIPSSFQIVLTRHQLSTQDSSVASWVSLHPTPNSFLPQKASQVHTMSWINYKRPILIQWLPAMLRCVTAPRLNYAWTRICSILVSEPKAEPNPEANTDIPKHIYMHVNTGHHYLVPKRVDSFSLWQERPNSAWAPKLGGSV